MPVSVFVMNPVLGTPTRLRYENATNAVVDERSNMVTILNKTCVLAIFERSSIIGCEFHPGRSLEGE